MECESDTADGWIESWVSRPSPLQSARDTAVTGVLIFVVALIQPPGRASTRWATVAPVCAAVAARLWLHISSHYVPEPYLDEIFHIPQAQKYCQGRYDEWDDKLTTPPGLYLLSMLATRNNPFAVMFAIYGCDAGSLRAFNALALLALTYLAMFARQQIEARLYQENSGTRIGARSQYAGHTALNIALFPLLFFFSGLYYTDLVSTAVVLAAFLNSLHRMGGDRPSFLSDVCAVFLGILSLLMRQTNVFWVVAFIGSLEGIHAVKTLRPERVKQPVMITLWDQVNFFAWRYSIGDIHDPPLDRAWPDDWLFSVLSILIAAVCNPVRVLRQVWPYITVLLSFVAFVIWNGGVVLGDKSNHVATIHLAQMLYIWPFFAFFSLPLLLPYALYPLNIAWNFVFPRSEPAHSGSSRKDTDEGKKRGKGQDNSQPKSPQISTSLQFVSSLLSRFVIWPVYLTVTVILSLVVVRFNTIIHPFTLADNRHYMFYIFRYTIRRGAAIRLLLVAPYTLSRWMVWGTLAGSEAWPFTFISGDVDNSTPTTEPLFVNHPLWIRQDKKAKRQTNAQYPQASEKTQLEVEEVLANDPLAFSTESVSTSTAIVLLLASSLSLITAPLVEPRYFIIPWVVWRLMVPAWRLPTGGLFASVQPTGPVGRLLEFFRHYDLRLVLETVWFLAINVVTGYIFLFKPFQWKAEDGSLLDEGRWQRFMW
ncbi:unnamed protein product [Clonostachys byssicola]|uniref:Dol-P-Glc:Glc(2)Man(9)GlcNAc(2)-PP-Dol alpha-1,2-glucosyltransferase n=1 Tax=Clonostachys byssicola TaxID=160290 RepID=A0A9N9U5K3_9HYPO|nr:unnamed protein product [Clonostachys byssicola]